MRQRAGCALVLAAAALTVARTLVEGRDLGAAAELWREFAPAPAVDRRGEPWVTTVLHNSGGMHLCSVRNRVSSAHARDPPAELRCIALDGTEWLSQQGRPGDMVTALVAQHAGAAIYTLMEGEAVSKYALNGTHLWRAGSTSASPLSQLVRATPTRAGGIIRILSSEIGMGDAVAASAVAGGGATIATWRVEAWPEFQPLPLTTGGSLLHADALLQPGSSKLRALAAAADLLPPARLFTADRDAAWSRWATAAGVWHSARVTATDTSPAPGVVLAMEVALGAEAAQDWRATTAARLPLPAATRIIAAALPNGHVLALAVTPDPRRPAVWRSVDSGASWEPLASMEQLGVSTLARAILLALPDGRAILLAEPAAPALVSADGGTTWQPQGQPPPWRNSAAPPRAAGVLPSGEALVVQEDGAVWGLGAGRAAAWHARGAVPTGPALLPALPVLRDGTVAAVSARPGDPLYLSSDAGFTWRAVPLGASVQAVVAAGATGDALVVVTRGLLPDRSRDPVLQSRDRGSSWEEVGEASGIAQVDSPAMLTLPPSGALLALGGNWSALLPTLQDAWVSQDGGRNWAVVQRWWAARSRHRTAQCGGEVVLAGGLGRFGPLNDVWRSADEGASWTQLTDSAPWRARHGFALATLGGGTQLLLMAGDAGDDSGLARQALRDVWRSEDCGQHWQCVTDGAPWPGSAWADAVTLPGDRVLLLLSGEVWRSDDAGASWLRVAASAPWAAGARTLPVQHAAPLPDGGVVVVGGAFTVLVYVSHDGGASWHAAAAPPLPALQLAAYAPNPHLSLAATPSGALVLLTEGSRTAPSVTLVSVDAGRSWQIVGVTDQRLTLPALLALPTGRLLRTGGVTLTLLPTNAADVLTLQPALRLWFGDAAASSARAWSALGTVVRSYVTEASDGLLAVGTPRPGSVAAQAAGCAAELWRPRASDPAAHRVWACAGRPVDVVHTACGHVVALVQAERQPAALALTVLPDGAASGVPVPSTLLLAANATLRPRDARLLDLGGGRVAVVAVELAGAASATVALRAYVIALGAPARVVAELRDPLDATAPLALDRVGVAAPGAVWAEVVDSGQEAHVAALQRRRASLHLLRLPHESQPPHCPAHKPVCADAQQRNCACANEAPTCLPPCLQPAALPARTLHAAQALLHSPGGAVTNQQCEPALRFRRRASVRVCLAHERLGARLQLVYAAEGAQARRAAPVFPDLRQEVHGGCLRPGDCVTLGPFSAGERVSFFLAEPATAESMTDGHAPPTFSPQPQGSAAVAWEAAAGSVLLALAQGEGGVHSGAALVVLPADDGALRDVLDTTRMCATSAGQCPHASSAGGNGTACGREAGNGSELEEGSAQQCAADWCCRAPDEPRREVEVGGLHFALLDNADPHDASPGCQWGRVRVPSGWQIAPPAATTFIALAQHPWAADCVALDDGSAYSPVTAAPCAGLDAVLTRAASGCVAVSACARVLIVKAADPDEGLVANPLLSAGADGRSAWGWERLGGGYTLTPDTACDRGNALVVRRSPGSAAEGSGASTALHDSASLRGGVTVSAWSRAEGVAAEAGGELDYALYMDVRYADGSFDYGLQARFTPGTHDWEYREAVILPRQGKDPTAVFLHLMLRGGTGTAHFSCLSVRRTHGNLLLNSRLAEQASAAAPDLRHWFHLDFNARTYTLTPRGISCAGVPHGAKGAVCGAQQFVDLSAEEQAAQAWDHVLLAGCARAEAVREVNAADWSRAGDPEFFTSDTDFSVYLDIWYRDGRREYSRAVPFSSGSYDWRCRAAVFPVNGVVERLLVAPLLRRRHARAAQFADLHLVPVRRGRLLARGACYGDPHLVSLGHQPFDVQLAGEHLLLRRAELEVHARFAAVAPGATVTTAVAVRALCTLVEVELRDGRPAPLLRVNRGGVVLAAGEALWLPCAAGAVVLRASGGQTNSRQPPAFALSMPEGQAVTVTVRTDVHGQLSLDVVVRAFPDGGGSGLLVSGSPPVTQAAVAAAGSAAEKAAVRAVVQASTSSASDSLFTRLPGESAGTWDEEVAGMNNLQQFYSEREIRDARVLCEAQLTNPRLQNACVLDVLAVSDPAAAARVREMEHALGLQSESEVSGAGRLGAAAVLVWSLAAAALGLERLLQLVWRA